MAFSDYKGISQVQAEFRIRYQEEDFIIANHYNVPFAFTEEFKFNQINLDVFSSEASRCEIIIFPILREVYKSYHQKVALWVQKSIAYNEKLNGTPDYVVSKKSDLGKTFLESPLLIIAEAKKNDFEQGWGQCLAELIAAQYINANAKLPIYGVVTDGRLWEFGKLLETVFTKNISGFTIDELPELFGALDFLFRNAISNE
ncbi:MAG: hypothetical protein JNK95_10230 [Candidatus Competibacter sp.]|nr:hypothetical protein [Candidatus Competibacter sp.]MDG4605231.1 hypothetical protein [Candidatus Contendobacter sp.]HRD50917.1 hypothetical protein [Candidatus Contendobacter sp.]